jgi:hypothetical protein
MNVSDYEKKALDQFWSAIEPRLSGYRHASFSYLAIKQDSGFLLIQGRLHLVAKPLNNALRPFESHNVRAGHCTLDVLGKDPKAFIEELLSGRLRTPSGEFVFPANANQPFYIYFNPHYEIREQPAHRRMQLGISGGNNFHIHPVQHDWELRANALPFDTIGDLCNEYGVPSSSDQRASIDVIADILADIRPASTIMNSRAFLQIGLADGLDITKASIGCSFSKNGGSVTRKRISGEELSWSKDDDSHVGRIEFDVPAGAILECVANYAEEAHHICKIVDPSTTRNSCRAIHQLFDPELKRLRELLTIEGKRKARDFEKPIAWLFGMLGFSVSHLDAIPQANGSPDLVAKAPSGNVVVIECTTGLLKAEHKLPNLVARTEQVRKALALSGHETLKVLPVLVTNRSLAEVKAEIEDANKMQVYVITSDDFQELIRLSNLPPDADAFYQRAEEQVALASKPNPFAAW